MLLCDLHKFLVLDLPLLIIPVEEPQHGGLLTDGLLQFLPGFHLHQPDPAITDGMCISYDMGFLKDHFAFHSFQVGNLKETIVLGASEKQHALTFVLSVPRILRVRPDPVALSGRHR